eukprot:TRINITY_DN15829_c2_g1_i3.p1 TRINITY_DN15829_c2_g1~~TRINITY_DN15829_c2_g1_i3.p1  ORF type:complete len:1325 (+),score=625.27 TRINITY_DN15829_c2_g1_i3:54-3977(+)
MPFTAAAARPDAAFQHTLPRWDAPPVREDLRRPRTTEPGPKQRHPSDAPARSSTPSLHKGGGMRGDLDLLKEQLAGLEEEERRAEAQQALERERAEQLRRKRQQDEEEAMMRELIELRTYQEQNRQERVRRQRAEAAAREQERAEKERKQQQAYWQMTIDPKARMSSAEAVSQAYGRGGLLEERRRSAESKRVLSESLAEMRRELAELDNSDWVQREAAARRRVAQRRDADRGMKEKEAEAEAAAAAAAATRKLSAWERQQDELAALRQELRLLEVEARRGDLVADARADADVERRQHAERLQAAEIERLRAGGTGKGAAQGQRAEAAAAELGRVRADKYQDDRAAAQRSTTADAAARREREILSDGAERDRLVSAAEAERAAEAMQAQQARHDEVRRMAAARAESRGWLERADFLDVEAAEIAESRSEQRAELERLRQEQRQLFEEGIAAENAAVDDELTAHAKGPQLKPSAPLAALLQQQQQSGAVTFTQEDLEAVQHAHHLAGTQAQIAAEEAQSSQRRIALLRREQELLQELADAARREADKAWEAEQSRAEEGRRAAEGRRQEQDRARAASAYDRDRAQALAERDAVRAEREHCLARLAALEREQADAALEASRRKQTEVAAELRREEGRMLSADAAARRAQGDVDSLRREVEARERSLREAEAERQRLERERDAAARRAREDAAACKIQGMHHIRQARGRAAVLKSKKREVADGEAAEDAATIIQCAYRGKDARSTVRARRAEVEAARRQRARDLLEQLEEKELRAAEDAVRQQLHDELVEMEAGTASGAVAAAAVSDHRRQSAAALLRSAKTAVPGVVAAAAQRELDALLLRQPSGDDKTPMLALALAEACACGHAVLPSDAFVLEAAGPVCAAARDLVPGPHVVALPPDPVGRAELIAVALQRLVDETSRGMRPGVVCFGWRRALGERASSGEWGLCGGDGTAALLKLLCSQGWRTALLVAAGGAVAEVCSTAVTAHGLPDPIVATAESVHNARCDAAAAMLSAVSQAPTAAADAVLSAVVEGRHDGSGAAADLLHSCLSAYREKANAAFTARFASEDGSYAFSPLGAATGTSRAVRWLMETAPNPHPPAPPVSTADRHTSAIPTETRTEAVGTTPRGPGVSGGCSPMTLPPTPPAPDSHPDDKLVDLECRITWLQRQLEEERTSYAERERERKVLVDQARHRELVVFERERAEQQQQIAELSKLLGEHISLVGRLQKEFEELVTNGPTAEDRERSKAAARIQATYRGYTCRAGLKRWKQRRQAVLRDIRMQEAAVTIQKHARGMIGRRRVKRIRGGGA